MEKLNILFEDNHLIVVLKPQNMPTQEDSSGDPDLLNAIKSYVKEKYDKPGDAFIGLVHRLDRPTGGVMVFARTSKAAARLAEQMKEGNFEKRYLAVVGGRPKDTQSRLINYLYKDEKSNTVKVVPASVEGAKKAELIYKTLDSDNKLSLVDIRLITGRAHQARVQMSYIGCPIFGDSKYGDKLGPGNNLALWAYELRFIHPTTKTPMTFIAYPPEDKVPWKYFESQRYINPAKPHN